MCSLLPLLLAEPFPLTELSPYLECCSEPSFHPHPKGHPSMSLRGHQPAGSGSSSKAIVGSLPKACSLPGRLWGWADSQGWTWGWGPADLAAQPRWWVGKSWRLAASGLGKQSQIRENALGNCSAEGEGGRLGREGKRLLSQQWLPMASPIHSKPSAWHSRPHHLPWSPAEPRHTPAAAKPLLPVPFRPMNLGSPGLSSSIHSA